MQSAKSIQRTYYLITFLYWFAASVPMAIFVLFMQARGLSLLQIGALMGFYSLTIVVLEVPTGGLADAIGRKRVTVLAYMCMTIGGLIFIGAFTFPIFLLAFVLSGLGRALASGALEAWFIDSLQAANPNVELQPALAKAETFALLALAVGTLSGSIIPTFITGLPPEGTAILTPLAIPEVVAFLFQIILLVVTITLVKEDRSNIERGAWKKGILEVPAIIGTAFRLTRNNTTILLLLGTTFASGLVIITLESFWQPYFAGLLGGSEGNTYFFGIVMGGNFLMGMIGNMLATPISRLFKNRYGLVCAIFYGLGGFFTLALAMQASTMPALIVFWLVYFNVGLINSPHKTLLNREIPAEHRSSMLSISSLATYVGATIGGIGLGYVAETISISVAWIIGGAVLMVSLFLYWQVDVHQRTNGLYEESYEQKESVLEAA